MNLSAGDKEDEDEDWALRLAVWTKTKSSNANLTIQLRDSSLTYIFHKQANFPQQVSLYLTKPLHHCFLSIYYVHNFKTKQTLLCGFQNSDSF